MKYLSMLLAVVWCASAAVGQTLLQHPDTIQDYHWRQLALGYVGINSLSVPSKDTLWAVTYDVLHSTDAGNSWNISAGPDGGPDGGYQCVVFTSGTTGYLLPYISHNIEKTTDGGLHWTAHASGTGGQQLQIVFPSRDTGFMISDTYVSRTTDTGETWHEGILGGLNCVAFHDHLNGCVGGPVTHYDPDRRKPDVGLFGVTHDAGVTWSRVFCGIHRDFQCLYALGPHTYIAGLNGGTMGRSTDDGSTWDTTIIIPNAGGLTNQIAFSDSLRGLVVGSHGLIGYTSDAGLHWSRLNSGVSWDLYTVQYLPDGHAYVAGDSSVILVNSNPSLEAVASGASPNVLQVSVYPNPVENQVHLDYSLSEAGHVSLDIYDVDGLLVTTTVSNELRQAGLQEETINTASLPAGIYVYQLYAAGHTRTGKFSVNR